jgi:hypothetical protein
MKNKKEAEAAQLKAEQQSMEEKKLAADKKKEFLQRASMFMNDNKTTKLTAEQEVRQAKEARDKIKAAKEFQNKLQILIKNNPGVSPTILEYRLKNGIDEPINTDLSIKLHVEEENELVAPTKNAVQAKRSAIAGGIKLVASSSQSPDSTPRLDSKHDIYSQLITLANGKLVWQVGVDNFICIIDNTCFNNNISDKNTSESSSSNNIITIGTTQLSRPEGKTYILEESYTDNNGVLHKGKYIYMYIYIYLYIYNLE